MTPHATHKNPTRKGWSGIELGVYFGT